MITPELVAFIKNALDKGQTKEQITNALLGAGWAQLDIIEAFQNTAPLQPSNPIPPVMAPIQQNPMASPMAIKTMPGTIATNVAVTNKPSGGSSGVAKMILGLILGLLLASAGWWYYFTQMNPVAIEEMPVMEEPVITQEPVQEPVSLMDEQNPGNTNPQEGDSGSNQNLEMYNWGDKFSFKYKTDASKIFLFDGGNSVSVVALDGSGANDKLTYYSSSLPGQFSCSSYPEGGKNITINGKNFVYCDSQGEPVRHYIYQQNGKIVTIDVGSNISSHESGFVDLGSIEIN